LCPCKHFWSPKFWAGYATGGDSAKNALALKISASQLIDREAGQNVAVQKKILSSTSVEYY